ncbi:MAG TPA: chaperone modulator CbpM [Devosiaceae bacterium]|nr:chaperone modulator CbpM [Devosiaceae bacterium]
MTEEEFIAVVQIDRRTLAVWIESGWLQPQGAARGQVFSEIDRARAQLISDLTGPLGVNTEGVDIILDLIDQLHGLRGAMRGLNSAVEAQPEDVRHRLRSAARRLAGSVREL